MPSRTNTISRRRPFVTLPRGLPILEARVVLSRPLYDVWEEYWDDTDYRPPSSAAVPSRGFKILVARNKNGDYIGDPSNAKYLCDAKGIAPVISKPGNSVCSIGYSEKDGKWYGWSHRALYGFRPGDVVAEGDCHADAIPPGTVARDITGARQFAEAFAESVS